jgi:hypothetical protein
MYLSDEQVQVAASILRDTMEVQPLTHERACELASQIIRDDHGFLPRKSLVLLCVNLARLQWEAIKRGTKAHLREINEAT